jgi:hypothetical protein
MVDYAVCMWLNSIFLFRELTAGGTPIVDSRAGMRHALFSAAV